MLEAVVTYKKAGLSDGVIDPFVEEVRRFRTAARSLAWMRTRAKDLLSSGVAEYVLAGEAFDGDGEVEEDLAPWELVGLDSPRRKARRPPGPRKKRARPKKKAVV
jgi:hypothetical protein